MPVYQCRWPSALWKCGNAGIGNLGIAETPPSRCDAQRPQLRGKPAAVSASQAVNNIQITSANNGHGIPPIAARTAGRRGLATPARSCGRQPAAVSASGATDNIHITSANNRPGTVTILACRAGRGYVAWLEFICRPVRCSTAR